MTNNTDNIAEAIGRFLKSSDQILEDYGHLVDEIYEPDDAEAQTGRQAIKDLMQVRPILMAAPEMINELRHGIEAATVCDRHLEPGGSRRSRKRPRRVDRERPRDARKGRCDMIRQITIGTYYVKYNVCLDVNKAGDLQIRVYPIDDKGIIWDCPY